jgi:RNA polymerase sigma-70 factor (ECF subfamily)
LNQNGTKSVLISGEFLNNVATARLRQLSLTQRFEFAQPKVQDVGAPHVSDEDLFSQIRGGDRDALSQLFRRYAPGVRSVGCRVLRDGSEADDLIQDVFLYIYRKNELFDKSKGSARSWIFQVAYTQAFIRRRQLNSIGFYASGIADTPLESRSPTNSGADYDLTVEALFGRNGWKQVLNSLTHEQRETLRLHFFEGYTFAEIAEKLGQSYTNVRHHHYRGLEKLRKHLSDDGLSRR